MKIWWKLSTKVTFKNFLYQIHFVKIQLILLEIMLMFISKGVVQDHGISFANVLETPQSCTMPLIYIVTRKCVKKSYFHLATKTDSRKFRKAWFFFLQNWIIFWMSILTGSVWPSTKTPSRVQSLRSSTTSSTRYEDVLMTFSEALSGLKMKFAPSETICFLLQLASSPYEFPWYFFFYGNTIPHPEA